MKLQLQTFVAERLVMTKTVSEQSETETDNKTVHTF